MNHERANELFDYDPMTGIVMAKAHMHGRRRGAVGYKVEKDGGYIVLKVGADCRQYYLHRIIWLMETGKWPSHIDHINGNATDNRWCNLREASQAENRKNSALRNDNKSGIAGVQWCKRRNHWAARINNSGQYVGLYFGNDFFEACCRRKSAELKYDYHENNGRKKVTYE